MRYAVGADQIRMSREAETIYFKALTEITKELRIYEETEPRVDYKRRCDRFIAMARAAITQGKPG